MASSRKPPRSKARSGPAPLAIDRALQAALQRASARKSKICIALSGGVDSVVLAHAVASVAKEHALTLSALHVNHGLSPSAYKWEKHCRALCRRLRIPLTVKRVKITGKKAQGLESAARVARYKALSTARVDFVALAHQMDDQAETVLLNLLRGAGLRGAAAMPELGKLPTLDDTAENEHSPHAFRPLLSVTREAIVAYAIAHRLHWDEDESNADEGLSRNWVRRSVAPLLASRYPRWRECLARAAAHFGEADTMLAASTAERLSVEKLRAAPKARAKVMLREFLRAGGTRAPDARQLAEMLRQLLDAGADTRLRIEHDGKVLRRYRDGIALLAPGEVDGEVVFHQCVGAGLDAKTLRTHAVSIRAREGGERLQLASNRPSRTLKNLFQEAGIAPWERDRVPLVYCGETLVWVPGLGIAAGFRAAKGRPGLLPEWLRRRQE